MLIVTSPGFCQVDSTRHRTGQLSILTTSGYNPEANITEGLIMDIFFQDPTAIPLPPEDVRIIDLRAEPLPDHRRVRIFLETTPFQKRPNGEVMIANPLGDEVANVSIVESISPRMEFIMHLRGEVPLGKYHLSAVLYYDLEGDNPDSPPEPRERMVVDRGEAKFEIRE